MPSKRERFNAAARHTTVDRPPVGAWIHYGSSYWTPEQVAEAHLRFYREYDWDYIKVMDDFRLDLPAGLAEITDPAQFDEILPDPSVELSNLAKQARVLEILREEAPEAAIIDTIFSPTQTLVRALGGQVIEYFKADPGLAHRTIGRVAQALVAYTERLKELDVDGVFLAVNGTSTDETSYGLTVGQFADWIAPYDRLVLASADGLVRIVHLHGIDANVELIRDYPAEVLSWSDKVSGPTIEEAVAGLPWVPMLGLDEINSVYWTPSQATSDALAARVAAADQLILAPNCTVHSDGSPAVLHALRAAADLSLAH